MTMPGDITFDSGTSYFGANLTAWIKNGTIPEARLDDMGRLLMLIQRYFADPVIQPPVFSLRGISLAKIPHLTPKLISMRSTL